jgi:hypothetical protein
MSRNRRLVHARDASVTERVEPPSRAFEKCDASSARQVRAGNGTRAVNGMDVESRRGGTGEAPMNEAKQRIEAATRAIAAAQNDVSEAITEIAEGARAEKRHAGDRLKVALDRLRGAQAELASLEELLTR